MFLNTLKITFRHLWRQKLFTGLNVLGLAIGISACWVIYSIVGYEFSFEKDFPNKENTYRLVSNFEFDGKESYNGGVSKPLYQAIREQVLGVARVVPVFRVYNLSTVETQEEGATISVIEDPQMVVATDSSYFEMTPYHWLAGNADQALRKPNQVVLTESRAQSYFGPLAPIEFIGKTLIYNDTLQKTVSGIVKDLSYPTEFNAQEFFAVVPEIYPLASWTNTNGADRVYLQMVTKGIADQVLKQIMALTQQKWREVEQESDDSLPNNRQFELLPLVESHFFTHINEYQVSKASKGVLYGLIGTGIFLLLLAGINYINMTTAQIPQRRKEFGVRKTLGGSGTSIVRQLLIETCIVTYIASIVGSLMTKLAFALLSDSIPEGSMENMDFIHVAFGRNYGGWDCVDNGEFSSGEGCGR